MASLGGTLSISVDRDRSETFKTSIESLEFTDPHDQLPERSSFSCGYLLVSLQQPGASLLCGSIHIFREE